MCTIWYLYFACNILEIYLCQQSSCTNFVRHFEGLYWFQPTCHFLYFISGPGTKCSNSWYFVYFEPTIKLREVYSIDYNGHSQCLISVNTYGTQSILQNACTHARHWSGTQGEEDAVSTLMTTQVIVEETRPEVL